jgi:hypothetical protein
MHYVAHMTNLQPVVGASAAVSGATAAAVRFSAKSTCSARAKELMKSQKSPRQPTTVAGCLPIRLRYCY